MANRRPEELAKEIVEEAFDVPLEGRDRHGGPPAQHDFDICWPDRPPGALEVTVLTDEGWHRLAAALEAHSDGIATEELRRRWVIDLSKEAERGSPSYREIRTKLVPHLVRLEAEGRQAFDEQSRWNSRSVDRLLAELPVDSGQSYESPKQPRVIINLPGRTARVWGEAAHVMIEEEVSGPRFEGERVKLAASGAEERHLFVWLHVTRFEAHAGLCDDPPPAKSPALPEEITTVWLAALCPRGPVVWRARPPDPWELIRPHAYGRIADDPHP